MERPPTTPITTFFKNRSVFITGATGFLGKATVEKLLRTCPELQAVYILIRPKSGSDIQTRLRALLDNSIFDTLRHHSPSALQKVIPIRGDITLPSLGISDQDQQTLASEVSIVIHSAATVKFDEKLKLSVNINVQGSQRVLELCKRMSNLVALVHVSTAYANCEREEIEELIYPPPADPNKLIETMEWMDEHLVDKITPQLIGAGNKPNTYTYTKALAEHVLKEEAQGLPICIVRPSIVTATWKEPVAGWVDNLNGPSGLMAAVADLVPLDFPVNLILAAAWWTAENQPGGIKVYNCCTGTENPLLWKDLENWGMKFLVSNPLSDVFWYPATDFKTNRIWHNITDFWIHFVPAYAMDVYANMSGRKPGMLRIYGKITKAVQSLEFFTTNQWRFRTGNVSELYEMMGDEDKRLFNLNVKEVKWPTYIGKYCLGLRKYTMRDDHGTLPAARKWVRKLYWIQKCTQFLLIWMFLNVIMFRFGGARRVWAFAFEVAVRVTRMFPS
ncbi:hypothetical protein Ocin01_13884 [Orchesella cincta]|uniref:Fatty acyl-CoA reductase n=1 Tax=Orchesella cincta TaxID=48709 RepID=A0A1D2MIG9_ORCCI|nr:hypothetical protein Ocin01_13884 [Orchesella cincta]